MCWLHHSWHYHSRRSLHLLRHSWMSHPHHLLMYILHHHFRTRRDSHEILLNSLSTTTRHHHLRILRITPHSRVTHSCSSHLLLLHHVNRHGISSIRYLRHITRVSTHWHWGSWHHRRCLMWHRSLLLSQRLLSELSLSMSERATIFVRTILS